MEIFLVILFIVLGVVLAVAGFVGCILPVLPGPPISFLAILAVVIPNQLVFGNEVSLFPTWLLIVLGLLSLLVLVADYLIPIYGTKKTGGSKYAIWGSAIGLIAGIFFAGPSAGLSLVAGPFAGAVIGELLAGKDRKEAVRSGFGAFLGFIAGTFSKVLVSLILTLFFIWGSFKMVTMVL